MQRSSVAVFFTLVGSGLALGGGCYTVEFDEAKPDVYYCQGADECLESQACVQFRCVDDTGPQVEITLPEPLTPIDSTDSELIVDYRITDFTISDSNENVEGQGKVLISIDDGEFQTLAVTEDGATVDISAGLELGAHRLWVQAVFGDGETVYDNPGATAYTVFFVKDPALPGSERPQIAIVSPGPNHTHVAGEALEVTVAVRNFSIVENGSDCHVDDGCDPWAEGADECLPDACELGTSGHAHIYIEPDYPACLDDMPLGCNGDYVLSLRPSESEGNSETEATAIIPGNRFNTPGSLTFSASLQYNDHDPYPNKTFIIFDQIQLEVVE